MRVMVGRVEVLFSTGAEGGTRTVQVAGVDFARFTSQNEGSGTPAPLEYQLLESVPGGGPVAGLIRFHQCAAPQKIRALAEQIFARLVADRVEILIVDARDNAGGGDDAWITLLEFLTDKPFTGYSTTRFTISQRLRDMLGQKGVTEGYGPEAWAAPVGSQIVLERGPEDLLVPPANALRFGGRWALLAGRGTFSSGMSFVCAVKAFALAPVVGQETGGRIKGFGQFVEVTLPRSGFVVAVSTKQFDGSVGGPLRRGVPPDVEVPDAVGVAKNSTDDPVIVRALKLLRQEGPASR